MYDKIEELTSEKNKFSDLSTQNNLELLKNMKEVEALKKKLKSIKDENKKV